MCICSRRSGFTLMEIMVVIIVIAVLASVAGPMIGSITDQGRASATKSKLSSLKSAIMAYNGDLARYPYWGNSEESKKSSLYNSNGTLGSKLFGDTMADNIFMNGEYDNTVFKIPKYNQKWKGPYMDSDPSDFMYDAWGTKIRYYAYINGLWLHAAGPDQVFSDPAEATKNGYDGDDIVLSVARLKGMVP